MKLDKSQIKGLMSKHIFLLSEDELISLAFFLDIKITDFKKNDWQVKFKMTQNVSTVFVECGKDSNISIGRTDKVKNGLSGLTSWGGCFSFGNAVHVFRNFFNRGYELTICSPEVLKQYNKEQWEENVLYANDLVIS